MGASLDDFVVSTEVFCWAVLSAVVLGLGDGGVGAGLGCDIFPERYPIIPFNPVCSVTSLFNTASRNWK